MTASEDAKRRGPGNQTFLTIALVGVDGGIENIGRSSIDASTLPGCT